MILLHIIGGYIICYHLQVSLGISFKSKHIGTSLVAQMVKNLPAMQEIWVRSLGQEDALEKGMATHSSVLPGEFH